VYSYQFRTAGPAGSLTLNYFSSDSQYLTVSNLGSTATYSISIKAIQNDASGALSLLDGVPETIFPLGGGSPSIMYFAVDATGSFEIYISESSNIYVLAKKDSLPTSIQDSDTYGYTTSSSDNTTTISGCTVPVGTVIAGRWCIRLLCRIVMLLIGKILEFIAMDNLEHLLKCMCRLHSQELQIVTLDHL
jgi:hypothetical protein